MGFSRFAGNTTQILAQSLGQCSEIIFILLPSPPFNWQPRCLLRYKPAHVPHHYPLKEEVLFIGTQFSNLSTAVDTSTSAACNAWCFFFSDFTMNLFRHLSFLTSPYAIQTFSRRLFSYSCWHRVHPAVRLYPYLHICCPHGNVPVTT